MGGDLSKAQKSHVRELREVIGTSFGFGIRSKGHAVGRKEIEDLLQYVWKHIQSYPEGGSLKVKSWKKIGEFLHEEPRAPSSILLTWRVLMDALATYEQPLLAPPEEGLPPYHAVRLLPPTAPPDKFGGLSGAGNTLSEDKSLPLRVQVDAVTAAIQEAKNRGELSGDDLLEFGVEVQLNPVEIVMDAALNPQREWKPLPLRVLKEVKQAAKEYGVRSPYTQALLEAVGYGNKMIPADWKALLNMILTPAQYLVLDQKWRQLAVQRGTVNVTPDQLYGAGNYTTVEQQRDGMPEEGFVLLPQIIFQAIGTLPDGEGGEKTFTNIKQGNNEPYENFISRLKLAIERQIDNQFAQKELLLKLAVEQANTDCRKILNPLVASGEREIADLINACRKVGSQSFNMETLALALQAGRAQKGNCFNCGKPGHFKAQCRAPGGGQSQQNMFLLL